MPNDPLIEEYVEKFMKKFEDAGGGLVLEKELGAFTRTSLKEYGDKRVDEIVEMVESIKRGDPRKEGHAPHPSKEWADCEACREDYHWNKALEHLTSLLLEQRAIIEKE